MPKSFIPASTCQTEHLYLLVKSYPNGILSSYITNNVPLDMALDVSCAKGNFLISDAVEHSRIAMLAAGSGLTPMLSIMEFLLQRRGQRL